MAFEEVDIIENINPAHSSGVSAGLVKLKRAKALLRLTIRSDVFEELGFHIDDRFALLLGKGEDHGIIRLRKGGGKIKASPRKFTGGRQGMTINLHHRPEFVDRAEKAVPCSWEIIDPTTVEIVLPPWADETGPGKSKRIAAIPPAIAAAKREEERIRSEQEAADRRRAAQDGDALRVEMDRAIAEALRDVPEFSIKLTLSQRNLLAVLVKKAGKVVTKEALMTLVYGAEDDAPQEKILDVQICKIRPRLPAGLEIETVWGEGYRLVGDVKLINAEQAAA